MNVNEKGIRGLIKTLEDLHLKGFYTFTAFDDHSPVDLIALSTQGISYRLQVKYRELMKNRKCDRYELLPSSVVNGRKVKINQNLIDGWAIYLANHNKVVYIPKIIMGNKTALYIDPYIEYNWIVSSNLIGAYNDLYC